MTFVAARSIAGMLALATITSVLFSSLATAAHRADADVAESRHAGRFSEVEIHLGRVDRELIVRLKPGSGLSSIDEFNGRNGAVVIGSIPALGMHLLRLPAGSDLGWIMRRYQRHPLVRYVELNYLGRGGELSTDDTHAAGQWHLDNRGQSGGIVDADIDATEGWEIARGSNTITVAILDTGIVPDHPEFEGRVLAGYDFVNRDDRPDADHAHGVLVAGLLAANADNGYGIAGVDHRARLLPVKVLDASGRGTTFELAQGLVYATLQGAHVFNMSLVDYPRLGKVLADAMAFTRKAGAVLISCAGNGARGDADHSYPGASPLTLSVGATDHDDARAAFSATGNNLDLVAPGVDVRTVEPFATLDGSVSFSGCSAAAALVSGVASLLLATDENLGHDLIRQILIQSAEDQVGPSAEDVPGWDEYFGFGRVSLDGALRLAESLRVVKIDILPGDDRNRLQPSTTPVVPVALLGDASFDVSTVNCTTLRFGPGRTLARDCEFSDIDGDGFLDLKARFAGAHSGMACGETEASLFGTTADGSSLVGSDVVTTYGCRRQP